MDIIKFPMELFATATMSDEYHNIHLSVEKAKKYIYIFIARIIILVKKNDFSSIYHLHGPTK